MGRNGLSSDAYHALDGKWNPSVGAEESRGKLDGRPVPFPWNEKTQRLDLKGLPENPPDAVCTVLDVDGD